MPLNKAQLKTDLLAAFTDAKAKKENPDAALDAIATAISDAVDAYVKTGTVTVASGIAVATTTPAGAGAGATTATGTGTIS